MRLVRDVMLPAPPMLRGAATIAAAIDVMREHECDVLGVLDGDRFAGTVDALGLTLFVPEARLAEAARGPAAALSAEMPLSEAAACMRSERAWHLPVVEGDRLVGLLTPREVLGTSPGGGVRLPSLSALLSNGSGNGNGKAHHPPSPAPPNSSGAPVVVLEDCRILSSGQGLEVTVRLRRGPHQHERRGVAPEDDLVRTITSATAKCVEPFAPEPVDLQVEETYEYTSPLGLTCVGATVAVNRGEGRAQRLVGVVPMTGSYHESYIHAVLDAANRWFIG